MAEEKLQIEIAEEENPQGADLSDDDLAASLGFMTTLSESMLPPPESEGGGEEGDMEDDTAVDTEGTPEKDGEQDERIANLEAELQRLLNEENNDQETEDTGTAE